MGKSKYLPAVNCCLMNGIKDDYIKSRGRWLPHFKPNQFNIFDKSCDVFCNECLLSSGHEPYMDVTTQYEQFRNRDRSKTMLMGDSGGFQIATDKLRINWNDPDNVDKVRLGILKFLEENCDIAATLDVPTFTIGKPGFKFNTYDQCLSQTLDNMDFWMKHRTPGKIRLLNVIQGRNELEIDKWINAVKDYETEGWCFSSANSDSIYHIFRSLIMLMKHKKLTKEKNWVHILGRTVPAVSVLLTDIQNRISNRNPEIQISYDSSSFVQAAITGSALDHTLTQKLSIGISKKDLSYEACKDQNITLSDYLGSDSILGKAIYLKDMYQWDEKKSKFRWDVPIYAQLMAYNYEITKNSMVLAQNMYENNDISSKISTIKNVILPGVFSKKTPDEMLDELSKYKKFLLNAVIKYDEVFVPSADLFLFDDEIVENSDFVLNETSINDNDIFGW